MIIKTLVENTAISPDFGNKHGLSFYLEVNGKKILFDLGQDDIFLKNGEKLGIDFKEIETVFISHGHYDHGGALGIFLKENNHAKIYIRENAFEKHYSYNAEKWKFNGLDIRYKEHPQLVLTGKRTKIDHTMELFSDITEQRLISKANNSLYMERHGERVQDDFSHEQSLLIKDGEHRILIAGCAHAGILNIMKRAEEILGEPLTHVFAGFHLYNPTSGKSESEDFIEQIAEALKKGNTRYYTGHCTGIPVFEKLKETLGDRVTYVAAGSVIEL